MYFEVLKFIVVVLDVSICGYRHLVLLNVKTFMCVTCMHVC